MPISFYLPRFFERSTRIFCPPGARFFLFFLGLTVCATPLFFVRSLRGLLAMFFYFPHLSFLSMPLRFLVPDRPRGSLLFFWYVCLFTMGRISPSPYLPSVPSHCIASHSVSSCFVSLKSATHLCGSADPGVVFAGFLFFFLRPELFFTYIPKTAFTNSKRISSRCELASFFPLPLPHFWSGSEFPSGIFLPDGSSSPMCGGDGRLRHFFPFFFA